MNCAPCEALWPRDCPQRLGAGQPAGRVLRDVPRGARPAFETARRRTKQQAHGIAPASPAPEAAAARQRWKQQEVQGMSTWCAMMAQRTSWTGRLPGSNGSGSSPARSRRSSSASAFLSSARHIQRPASAWRSAARPAHCAAAMGSALSWAASHCASRRASLASSSNARAASSSSRAATTVRTSCGQRPGGRACDP
ncbi:MAG: hypothetical protein J3K34DRAFT_423978 [Monoraphidium minutum]|nr:MAG: hypothetical protein J3K34DRAFT_423978 [Monoraphidium minutum]